MGGGVLQTHHGGDVAGVDGLDVLAVIGVHLQDAAHTLALALGGIEDGGTRGQRTGVHAEEAQTAHIGVSHDLKGQRGEGLVVGRLALLLLVGPGVDALDGRNVGGCGQTTGTIFTAQVALRMAARILAVGIS